MINTQPFRLPFFLGVLVSAVTAPGEEYEKLSDIEDRIGAYAATAGTDASRSALLDASGNVIQTEGTPGPYSIYLLKIAKGGSEGERKNILVVGNQHAREWISYRCVLDMAKFIIDQRPYETWPNDPQFVYFTNFKEMNIKELVYNANIFCVAMANPAGYAYSRSGHDFRKNRRNTVDDTLGNGLELPFNWEYPGVDLNRNWPTSDWGHIGTRAFPPGSASEAQIKTCRHKDRSVYCGRPKTGAWPPNETPNPALEPMLEEETEAVAALSNSRMFHCVINLHSYGPSVGWSENVDLNEAHLRPNQGWQDDQEIMKLLSHKAAAMMINPDPGYDAYSAKMEYPVSGDILWFHYDKAEKKALTFVIEAGNDHQPANAGAHAQGVLPGQLFMMFAAIDTSFASKPTATFGKP